MQVEDVCYKQKLCGVSGTPSFIHEHTDLRGKMSEGRRTLRERSGVPGEF